jgi:hypothetical protein
MFRSSFIVFSHIAAQGMQFTTGQCNTARSLSARVSKPKVLHGVD